MLYEQATNGAARWRVLFIVRKVNFTTSLTSQILQMYMAYGSPCKYYCHFPGYLPDYTATFFRPWRCLSKAKEMVIGKASHDMRDEKS